MPTEFICANPECKKVYKNIHGRCSCNGSTFSIRDVPEQAEEIRVTIDFMTEVENQNVFAEIMELIKKLPKLKILKASCEGGEYVQEQKPEPEPVKKQEKELTIEQWEE